MAFNWIQIIGITLLALGLVSLVFVFWYYLDERNTQARKYYRQNQESNYTEEERFYANLLLKKNELDADAFKTRKAMFDEALKHQRK